MKKQFNGKYVSGILFKGISGKWCADVSYFGTRSFDTEMEAIEWMKSVGCFQ